MFGLLAKSKLV